MMLAWLTLLNTLFAPVVGAILKLLFQLKIIKTEADLAETQRRFQAAIKSADQVKGDSVDAQRQYDGASKEADAKWKKTFGE
jgi:hypothetical protein